MNSGGLLYMYCTICTMYSVVERVDGADVAPSRDKLFYFLLIFISRLFSLLSRESGTHTKVSIFSWQINSAYLPRQDCQLCKCTVPRTGSVPHDSSGLVNWQVNIQFFQSLSLWDQGGKSWELGGWWGIPVVLMYILNRAACELHVLENMDK